MNNILFMPFMDETKSFANGFECGKIWQRISEGDCFDNQFIHLCNQSQIEMICKTFGVNYQIIPLDDTWGRLSVNGVDI